MCRVTQIAHRQGDSGTEASPSERWWLCRQVCTGFALIGDSAALRIAQRLDGDAGQPALVKITSMEPSRAALTRSQMPPGSFDENYGLDSSNALMEEPAHPPELEVVSVQDGQSPRSIVDPADRTQRKRSRDGTCMASGRRSRSR